MGKAISRHLSIGEIRKAIDSGDEVYLGELLYFFDNANVSLFVNKKYRKRDVAFELKGLMEIIDDGRLITSIRGEGRGLKSALEDLCDKMSNKHIYSEETKKHYLLGLITAHEPLYCKESEEK